MRRQAIVTAEQAEQHGNPADKQAEYVSLCTLLGKNNIILPTSSAELDNAISAMKEELEQKTMAEYISSALSDSLKELGYTVEGSETLIAKNRTIEKDSYNISPASKLNVSSSTDGAVMFEVVGRPAGKNKTAVRHDMEKFCPDYQKVKAHLADKGVELTNEKLYPPSEEYVRFEQQTSTITHIYPKAFSFVQCKNLYIATGTTANWNSVFSISDKEYNWMECLNICNHIYSGSNEVRGSALEFVAEMTFFSNPLSFSPEQRKDWSEWISAQGKGKILDDVLGYAEFFVDSRKGEDSICTVPLRTVLVLNLATTSAVKSRLGRTSSNYKEIIRLLSSYLADPSKIIAEAGYTQEQLKELCSLVGTKPPKIK